MRYLPARLRRSVVVTVLAGLTLTACGHADPGVAAYVGDDEVTQSQVDQAVKGLGSIVEAGQSVSVEAVVNAMIQGELAEQIAAEQKIDITDAARDKVLKGTNLADLVKVTDAQPVVFDVADQAIVSQKLGNAAYLAAIKKVTVTLNPRYGVLDPAQKTILTDQSGSLSVPAPNASVAAPLTPEAAAEPVPAADPTAPLPEVARLVAVMEVLRRRCPWDAEQTHRSLVQYLVEEAMETVEAIEAGDLVDLREELGDLLLQVVFHAGITDAFDLDDVARGVADKLVGRHPYVFAGDGVPTDLHHTWEQRKALEKGRTSALQGIPEQLSALARAHKIISRARSRRVPLTLPTEPVTAETVGTEVLALVARAQAAGIDPEQAVRDAVRGLEAQVRAAEVVPAGPSEV